MVKVALKMTPEGLARKLSSRKPHDRLEAARFLAEAANPDDVAQIEKALAVETVTWVRGALGSGLIASR